MSVKRLSIILNYAIWAILAADVVITLTAPVWVFRMGIMDFNVDPFLKFLALNEAGGMGRFILAFTIYCGIVLAAILFEVTLLLRGIIKGEPFCARNAKSLKAASYLSFALCAAFIVKCFVNFTFLTFLCVIGIFVLAMIFIVLACLFRVATEIREENDLTI